jgi:hypothetical protein
MKGVLQHGAAGMAQGKWRNYSLHRRRTHFKPTFAAVKAEGAAPETPAPEEDALDIIRGSRGGEWVCGKATQELGIRRGGVLEGKEADGGHDRPLFKGHLEHVDAPADKLMNKVTVRRRCEGTRVILQAARYQQPEVLWGEHCELVCEQQAASRANTFGM